MVGQVAELVARVERDLQQWVIAAVESCLGSLETVGALAVEDFLVKMKGAIRDIGQFTSVPGDNDSVPRPPSLAGSATGGNSRSDDVAAEVFLVGWKSYRRIPVGSSHCSSLRVGPLAFDWSIHWLGSDHFELS